MGVSVRPIKFRAWLKEGKGRMVEVRAINFDGGLFFANDKGIQLETYFTIAGHVLMQYTGLKDAKGKEIYEGDIVKTDDQYYPKKIVTYTSDVVNEHDGDWDEWYCGFDLTVPKDECKVLHYQLSDKVEVIGNIYENKELIE